MSQLDDLIAEGLSIAGGVMGEQQFSIDTRPYCGILNEFEGEQEIELDGVLASYNATLVCEKPQFRQLAAPLTKTLRHKIVVIDSMRYKAKRVVVDSVSVTLGLEIAR